MSPIPIQVPHSFSNWTNLIICIIKTFYWGYLHHIARHEYFISFMNIFKSNNKCIYIDKLDDTGFMKPRCHAMHLALSTWYLKRLNSIQFDEQGLPTINNVIKEYSQRRSINSTRGTSIGTSQGSRRSSRGTRRTSQVNQPGEPG